MAKKMFATDVTTRDYYFKVRDDVCVFMCWFGLVGALERSPEHVLIFNNNQLLKTNTNQDVYRETLRQNNQNT